MNVFFYGLFMDAEILAKNGITATLEKGYLKDYTLKIGNRASLVSAKNESAYGMVCNVNQGLLDRLYAEPSVIDYVPEEVFIHLNSGKIVKGMCYNLPSASISGTNTTYATSLYKLATKLDFPKYYLDRIKTYIE